MRLVPPAIRIFRADAEVRTGKDDPGRTRIREREQQVAALDTEHRPALEKEGDIRSETAGDILEFSRGCVQSPQQVECLKGRGRVAAAAAEPRFRGNPLGNE